MSEPTTKTLVLSASDIEEIVRTIGIDDIMDELIDRMAIAFKEYDPSQTIIPVRSGFNYQQPQQGLIEWMPLFNKGGHEVVVKMVGYHPNNPDTFQLPTIISTISCYDTKTGHLKGLMDGVFLTALRTGAASAIASKTLAYAKSSNLGLIGCGAQAVTQLHAISRVFKIKKVYFYDKDEATQNSFVDRIALLNLDTEFISTSIEEIVELSDIITTATSIEVGEGPLFGDTKHREWLHVNAVGADFPGKTELPISFLKKSFVCPDFLAQALKEGECQRLDDTDIGPDFFECIQHPEKYKPVQNTTTVFDSTGLPLEDQVVMNLFLEYANTMKLGQELSIEIIPDNAKSPYEFMYMKETLVAKKLSQNNIFDKGETPSKFKTN